MTIIWINLKCASALLVLKNLKRRFQMKKLTKIREFARGKPCSLRIPGVCREAPDNENVVLCHAPYPGRHGSRKDDHWGAPGCVWCHDYVDGRSTGVKKTCADFWMPAIHEWQAMLIAKGLLKVYD